MHILSASNINISSSKFLDGFALSGGAIYSQGDSNLYIFDTFFSENIALNEGGAICADSFSKIIIDKC